MKTAVILLVDLAGCEKVGKVGATDGRLKEATGINKYLSILGLIISTFVEKAIGKRRVSLYHIEIHV